MLLFILFLFLIFPISLALAEDSSIEEIIVTATRVEEPKRDVPYSVQIITQEDIKNSTAKNLGDLIVETA
ncbi:MAG: TonB-dependent receptor, partial [Thermodesulfovibrio sp.]|nr:TonB-dependent receptor [Thermodesulfovibrio sp.]